MLGLQVVLDSPNKRLCVLLLVVFVKNYSYLLSVPKPNQNVPFCLQVFPELLGCKILPLNSEENHVRVHWSSNHHPLQLVQSLSTLLSQSLNPHNILLEDFRNQEHRRRDEPRLSQSAPNHPSNLLCPLDELLSAKQQAPHEVAQVL